MEIKIETVVTRDVLENVCVTALEGGSNYWAYLSSESRDRIRRLVSVKEDPYISSAILKAVLDHTLEIPIHDVENTDEVLGVLSRKTLTERIKKLSSDESLKWALENEINDVGDAESSDVVFQYMVMGEVIYG